VQVIKIVSYYPLCGERLASICHILKAVLCGLQGYYRRGAAYLALGKFKEALKDFKQVPILPCSEHVVSGHLLV
jgi:hypothetical protein